jgi:predicted transcriptional regulator
MALARYTLFVKDKQHKKLEILMEEFEENKSNLIRLAIDQYLEKHRDIIDAKS